MKIYSVTPYLINSNYTNQPKNHFENREKHTVNTELKDYFNDYQLFFGARVDKGLDRFYEANKDRMPYTVKTYIDNLDSRDNLTPLEAQRKAYRDLNSVETVADIKRLFPDEQLFKRLINPEDTRATQGLLYSIRENKELMDLMDKPVLKTGENLTVYLVKKIFLENKTMEEINKDLDADLDEDLKIDFRFRNKDSRYILNGTLNSLGIVPPDFEYRASLRYTKDGYSDMIGEKISEAQRQFWDSMPPEERTARARKSVQKFENWWASIPRKKKLEMIADQLNELDLLAKFNAENPEKSRKPKTNSVKPDSGNKTEGSKTKVGSEQLSRDDLFKIWAKNNLKLYMENLSESDKKAIEDIKTERMLKRWQEMSPAEKTAYIAKIKAGQEPLRFAMIDAWNNSFDIIKDLSLHLMKNQIYKPAYLLYSNEAFSDFQSRVMNEFWEEHPEYTEQLGENIRKSNEKVKKAINSGEFENLKKEISRQKTRRINELSKLKLSLITPEKPAPTGIEPQYLKDFKNAYYKVLGNNLKNLPEAYNDDYFRIIGENFSERHINAWTKNLLGQYISSEEMELLQEIKGFEPKEAAYINRALEGALSNILYDCTKNPVVYSLSFSDLKVALAQVARGEPKIDIYSYNLKHEYTMPIVRYKVDKDKIAALYNMYLKPIPEKELAGIAKSYFKAKDGNYNNLIEYLKSFGSSLNIIFSEKSVYPVKVKGAMIDRLLFYMPKEVYSNYECLIRDNKSLEIEAKIQKTSSLYQQKYNFIPEIYFADYFKEIGNVVRQLPVDERIAYMRNMQDYQMSNESRLKKLALGQVLADILYYSTKDVTCYSLPFPEAMTMVLNLQNTKKFPAKLTAENYPDRNYTAKKKPLISKQSITKKYLEYLDDINSRINDKENTWDEEELICALNPNANAPEIDEQTRKRIIADQISFNR